MSAIGGPSGCDPTAYSDAPAEEEAAPSADAAPAATPPAPPSGGGLLERAGRALGLGLGVVVTEGLRLAPGWDDPVLGADGKPVDSVPGAVREGDYEIRKRHEEVVGPAVAKQADATAPGMLKDFLTGFGEGASEAPGASYRIDAKIDEAL
jgi:hypothetical protein